MLDRAPDKAAVLAAFKETLIPNAWSGDLSAVLDGRREQLAILFDHPDETVRQWAAKADRALAERAEGERDYERTRNRRAQSFE